MSEQSLSWDQVMAQAGVTAPPAPTQSVAVAEPENIQDLPYITATYSGFYYKPAGSKGTDVAPFSIEVKVPKTWLTRDDYSPKGFFKALIAPRVMPKQYPDYDGLQITNLVTTSALPAGLEETAYLNWTTDMTALTKYAQDRKLPINFELYPETDSLRQAIFRCSLEREAFLKEQEMLGTSKLKDKRAMEAELAALGY